MSNFYQKAIEYNHNDNCNANSSLFSSSVIVIGLFYRWFFACLKLEKIRSNGENKSGLLREGGFAYIWNIYLNIWHANGLIHDDWGQLHISLEVLLELNSRRRRFAHPGRRSDNNKTKKQVLIDNIVNRSRSSRIS